MSTDRPAALVIPFAPPHRHPHFCDRREGEMMARAKWTTYRGLQGAGNVSQVCTCAHGCVHVQSAVTVSIKRWMKWFLKLRSDLDCFIRWGPQLNNWIMKPLIRASRCLYNTTVSLIIYLVYFNVSHLYMSKCVNEEKIKHKLICSPANVARQQAELCKEKNA